MHSDTQFILFRKFGQLHARILLHKQDVLVELEQRLNNLDNDETNAFFLSSRRSDENAERLTLLDELEIKLKEYSECINGEYQDSDR